MTWQAVGAAGQGGRHGPDWLHRWPVPLLLAASGWAVLALTAWGGNSPLRAIAVFAFVLVLPGAAITRLLPLRGALVKGVLAIALSMSLAALTAELASIGHVMHTDLVLAVLAGICSAAALTELALPRR